VVLAMSRSLARKAAGSRLNFGEILR